MTDHVKSLTDYLSLIGNSSECLLVEFTACWSIPSNILSQDLQQILCDYNLKHVVINFNDCPEVFQKYKVNVLPCIKLIKDGIEIGQVRGNNFEAVKIMLDNYISRQV